MRCRLDITLKRDEVGAYAVSNDGVLGGRTIWTPAELRELARALNILATDAERHEGSDLRLVRDLGTGRAAEF